MPIWTYGHMRKKYGQVGYPRKEHQKCSSDTLTSGPQDTPFKSYGKKCIVILPYTAENIRSMFSRLVRDLVQKAKWPEILCRSRIQAAPTLTTNLPESVTGQWSRWTRRSFQFHLADLSRIAFQLYEMCTTQSQSQGLEQK